MSHNDQHGPAWWGQYSLDTNQTAQWQIGPLKLAVRRQANEWQVGYEPRLDIDPDNPHWQFQRSVPDVDLVDFVHTARHATGKTDEAAWLRPLLADRSLISRPLTPLYVPAGETAIIFVRSPLWLRIEAGSPPKILQELPMQRPSDTWFGPSTMEGELCYASPTYARLDLDNLSLGPHHAVTQMTIENRADSHLLVERLKLPVPYLALFEASDGLLWTQAVTMTRSRDTAMADFQIEQKPPQQAGVKKRLSEPRLENSIRTTIYTFGALLRA
jgi:hypothetical protein